MLFFYDLILGIGCALVCGFLMARKGRSPHVGVALGLLLGPIGLIIVALLRTTESGKALQETEMQIASEDVLSTRPCPICGRINSIRTLVCPHCETRLDSNPA